MVCIGLVLGAEALQPIRWRVWAGAMEKESPGGPFRGLEERVGFTDIRVTLLEMRPWPRSILGMHDGGILDAERLYLLIWSLFCRLSGRTLQTGYETKGPWRKSDTCFIGFIC